MKDHKIENVTLEAVNQLIAFASGQNVDMECFEGTLVDEYVLYGTKRITMNKAKPREYIIVESLYRSEWGSRLNVIMTDSLNQVERFVASRRAEEDEQDD